MHNLYLYTLISALTIASPGPGVILSLTNSLNYSLSRAIPGFIGVAVGMATISVIAATSLGLLLTSSNNSLIVIQLVGGIYLAYLGQKLFRSIPRTFKNPSLELRYAGFWKTFREGYLITLLNPKPIVFFMALFPQFTNSRKPFFSQFIILSAVFCCLCFLIHFLYGMFAHIVKQKMKTGKAFLVLNRTGGIVFCFFATILIYNGINLVFCG
ncbi:LysE family translocator [Xenorhabdus sp. KJ12.1]|uniref:LysE family translocator n=1 Tax=Xenorhabdus sp. KJ12.1 TaxID=1851571 RepID=UPI000C03C0F6|nr:LysE family translocator [Xenorhabdus sp. KJ12.1]PHM72354.1 lysine transporter LysE [Xenorhabdus sp. KJ12.1]